MWECFMDFWFLIAIRVLPKVLFGSIWWPVEDPSRSTRNDCVFHVSAKKKNKNHRNDRRGSNLKRRASGAVLRRGSSDVSSCTNFQGASVWPIGLKLTAPWRKSIIWWFEGDVNRDSNDVCTLLTVCTAQWCMQEINGLLLFSLIWDRTLFCRQVSFRRADVETSRYCSQFPWKGHFGVFPPK